MRSLLADIRGDVASSDPVRRARDAVVENLRTIIATPRGSALLLADYGVEDALRIFHEYPGSIPGFRRSLAETLARYEPRLRHVVVRHLEGRDLDLTLRFEIEGVLVVEGALVPVRFTTTLDTKSRFDVA